MPTFLTSTQVSDLLAVPTRTLADWRYRGMGPQFIRLTGAKVRYDLADVLAWIESSKVGA